MGLESMMRMCAADEQCIRRHWMFPLGIDDHIPLVHRFFSWWQNKALFLRSKTLLSSQFWQIQIKKQADVWLQSLMTDFNVIPEILTGVCNKYVAEILIWKLTKRGHTINSICLPSFCCLLKYWKTLAYAVYRTTNMQLLLNL